MKSLSPILLRPTVTLRSEQAGRCLIGGSPARLMRLSPTGAAMVARWFDGSPVGPDPAHQALARRLIEADMASVSAVDDGSAIIDPTAMTGAVTVVIPVRDDHRGLATTLDRLGIEPTRAGADPGGSIPAPAVLAAIIIVDDGSEIPVDPEIGASCGVPVSVIRRCHPSGPGNARNLGFASVSTPNVVFIDAGVRITAGQLATLTQELAVGDTVAVAPRVRSQYGPAPLARYERTWSPLDMGPHSGQVGPGRRLPYVPSTCLALRSSAVTAAGGFDPGLRYGEDVDLVWRLAEQGWVRYLGHVEVTHPPRATVSEFIRQRFHYGRSAGPLARRHRWAVAPVRLDRRSAAAWSLLLARLPWPALAVAGWSTLHQRRALIDRGLTARQVSSMIGGHLVATTNGLAVAAARTWWPLVVGLTLSPIGNHRLASLLLGVGWLRRLRLRDLATGGPIRQRGTDVVVGAVDDSAYALGVWSGALRARTCEPLLPEIISGDRVGR